MLSEKKQLREKLLTGRNKLTLQEILEKSALIKEKLFSLKEFQQANNILFYLSFKSEVSTREMIEEAKQLGKKVFIPKISIEKNSFELSKFTSFADLKENKFGILEAEKSDEINLNELDLIIVPGLGFDSQKNRLGFGKAFYDRLIHSLPKKIPLIALAFELQLLEKIPSTESDKKVDKIVSEKRII